MHIYKTISDNKKAKRRMFAVLIDPDKCNNDEASEIALLCKKADVDLVLTGGSLLISNNIENCIRIFREICGAPVMLFPGGVLQISSKADGIFLLSLISGRNPDMLISKHVESATLLRESKLEIIPTGYMLIDGGITTSVQYMSNTMPIPANKNEIAVSTAIAGEMLGMKMIYLEAGSGALNPVPAEMISEVRKAVSLPLIVGGGIRSETAAVSACKAGADIIVAGNIFEKKPELIINISDAIHNC